MGDLSPHFSRSEFRCHHCGALVGPDIKLVDVLEKIRALYRRPLIVVSGYRCSKHNRAVGGAKSSQHLRGTAADIRPGVIDYQHAYACGARGIGTSGSWVTHVDVRSGPFASWRY